MAKKRRLRVWWHPIFEEDYNNLRLTKRLGRTNGASPLMFDSQNAAYAYALSNRLVVKHDEDGNPIVNDSGHAQLDSKGYIYLIGVKGQAIDWKEARVNKFTDACDEVLAYDGSIHIDKQTIKRVIKETEDGYKNQMASPMAKAGGIVYESNDHATDEVQSIS